MPTVGGHHQLPAIGGAGGAYDRRPLTQLASSLSLNEREAQQQQITVAEGKKQQGELEGLRTELRQCREDMKGMLKHRVEVLEKKDEALEQLRRESVKALEKKDEALEMLLEKKDEAFEQLRRESVKALEKKDEALERLREAHRDDMNKKDERHRQDMKELRHEHKEEMHRLLQAGAPLGMLPTQSSLPQIQPTPPAIPSAARVAAGSSPRRATETALFSTSSVSAKELVTQLHHHGERRINAPQTAPPQTTFAPAPAAESAEQLVASLQVGGNNAEAALSGVLEASLAALETLMSSTPRKQRRGLRMLREKVEEVLDGLDNDFLGRLSTCVMEDLMRLGEKMCAVLQLLHADEAGMECVAVVEGLLGEIAGCGDVVAGASRQLASAEESVRMRGIEALRALPRVELEESVAAEIAAAAVAVKLAADTSNSDGERAASGWALFTLFARNGPAAIEVIEEMFELFYRKPFEEVTDDPRTGGVCLDGREGVAVFIAANALVTPGFNIAHKYPAVKGRILTAFFSACGAATLACSKTRYKELLSFLIEATGDDDVYVASSACSGIGAPTGLAKTGEECADVFLQCDIARVAWNVRLRVAEAGLPGSRWCEISKPMGTQALSGLDEIGYLALTAATLAPAIPHTGVWPAVVAEAAHLAKVNAEMKLLVTDRFAFGFTWIYEVLQYATRDAAHRPNVLSCSEALLWASDNGFDPGWGSTAAPAAAACVSLLGKNEGGLTLDKHTIDRVVSDVHRFYDTSPSADWVTKTKARQLPVKVVPMMQLIVDMSMADANQPLLLAHPHALKDLVTGLLLEDSNPRRCQDGADQLQAICARALENLALSEVGKTALRAHTGVMEGLRVLQNKGSLSDGARRSASAALFELDEVARRKTKEAATNVEHIMLSYNWGNQEEIKRINGALKNRGYVVWIDIEKMQGSTVEMMADAVEGAAIMCYGISEAYKESANCRLEAQYAYQRKKEMIPLMMQDGYNANGWLGMLLGVRLWYGFYGKVLESDEAFEGKVNELCRELGGRGKG